MYHLFLLLSTFTRGLVEVFSLVLLYRKGFEVHEIFFFLFFMYSIGILVNYVSLKMAYRVVFFISSILYGISFIFLSVMSKSYFSLFILAILLACSTYSYHSIRHYLAIVALGEKRKQTNRIVITMFLGMILSSIVGIFLIDYLSLFWVSLVIFICSFLSLIPLFYIDSNMGQKRDFHVKIKLEWNQVIFSILEQFKVIFLELQPLFLYLYVKSSISYVGIFNLIVNLAAFLMICLFSKWMNGKHIWAVCLGLGIVFIFKLNVSYPGLLFILAFLEGIFVKIYETVSLKNLYDFKNFDISSYLILEEFIFFFTKSVILFLVWFFRVDFRYFMYFLIGGIMVSGWFVPRKEKKKFF